jgi:hypothetical protein
MAAAMSQHIGPSKGRLQVPRTWAPRADYRYQNHYNQLYKGWQAACRLDCD